MLPSALARWSARLVQVLERLASRGQEMAGPAASPGQERPGTAGPLARRLALVLLDGCVPSRGLGTRAPQALALRQPEQRAQVAG